MVSQTCEIGITRVHKIGPPEEECASMKPTISVPVCVAILSVVAIACGTIIATPTPDNELDRMISAQEQATDAARSLQRVAAQATSRADATREALILIGQQTRIAQEAMATQTTFAQRVSATTTAQSVMQTRTADEARATATAVSAQSTATVQAAQYTATAHAVIVEATQVSASATATANAANARATRIAADATATVTTAQVLAAQEKAEWDKRLEAGRAIASFLGWTIALIACAVIVGFGVIRFIDAGVLRARVLRDKTGTVLVIGEKDADGRQMVLIPGRSPGAAMMLTPPGTPPLQIEAGVVDEETTKRDQAISLMIAATLGRGNGADELMDELTEGDQIRIVDEPPPQIVSGDVRQLIDTNWKELGDGSE